MPIAGKAKHRYFASRFRRNSDSRSGISTSSSPRIGRPSSLSHSTGGRRASALRAPVPSTALAPVLKSSPHFRRKQPARTEIQRNDHEQQDRDRKSTRLNS